MILTINELRSFVDTDLTDETLAFKLSAIETAIRKYTNNNFQNRAIRASANIIDDVLCGAFYGFSVGDTIEISQSVRNAGLYVIEEATATGINAPGLKDEVGVLVTLVEYPPDVKMGVINLMDWELKHRDKIGISSETISRHSVTYFNMDGGNSSIGFPASLLGFLKPYMKARF